jgi:hypothetical protein
MTRTGATKGPYLYRGKVWNQRKLKKVRSRIERLEKQSVVYFKGHHEVIHTHESLFSHLLGNGWLNTARRKSAQERSKRERVRVQVWFR